MDVAERHSWKNLPEDTRAVHTLSLAATEILDVLSRPRTSPAATQVATLTAAMAKSSDDLRKWVRHYYDATINPALHDAVFACPDLLAAVETDEGSLLIAGDGSFARATCGENGWTVAGFCPESGKLIGPVIGIPDDTLTDSIHAVIG